MRIRYLHVIFKQLIRTFNRNNCDDLMKKKKNPINLFDWINRSTFSRIYKLYEWIKQTNKQTNIYSLIQRWIDFIGSIDNNTPRIRASITTIVKFLHCKLLYKSDSIWATISRWLTASGCLDTFQAHYSIRFERTWKTKFCNYRFNQRAVSITTSHSYVHVIST